MQPRLAKLEDLPDIVRLLSNDLLGQQRETYRKPLPEAYLKAYSRISTDPMQELVVLESDSSEIIGTLQLSFIPYLTYRGGLRAQIEAVRVDEAWRGKGIGKHLLQWAVQRAREKGAHLVQLTTDKQRPDAIEFYKSLGFKASHEGMKLHFQ